MLHISDIRNVSRLGRKIMREKHQHIKWHERPEEWRFCREGEVIVVDGSEEDEDEDEDYEEEEYDDDVEYQYTESKYEFGNESLCLWKRVGVYKRCNFDGGEELPLGLKREECEA